MANSHRIVIIDHHIIAQFHDGLHWWTMSKASNNAESDFALWEEDCALWERSGATMQRAVKLAGADASIVRSDLCPVQSRGGWLANPADLYIKPNTPEGYRQALRELARSIT